MSANPFSETIPFRQGNPAHLLNCMSLDDGDAILLDEQALRILKEIEEPIAVITVGKSYFANTLLGRHDGFELGSSVNGCTKGIDIWNTPFYHDGKRVVIIDCEGINDPNQEVPWANKLFVLSLAISSTLIYNINGIIGRDDIEKLFLMTKIASLIQPPNEYNFLPNLVVLLRDFQLDSPPDFVEYFLDRLSKVNEDAAKEITAFFKKFQVYAIPETMRNMSTIKTEQLDPIFVTKVEEAVTNIFEELPPKYLNASPMTGVNFAEFLEKCVAQINDPTNTMLSIPSAYKATINYAAHKAYETCLEIYDEMMNQMSIIGFPIHWDKFEDVHAVAFEFAHKHFIQQIVGSADQIQSFQKTFYDKIIDSKDKFYKENSIALREHHENWADKLWKENDTENFEDAIELFEQTYGTIAIRGQEAAQVLNDFKANQYEDAIKILNKYDAVRDDRASEILERQHTERKYYEILQEEGEILTEITNASIENETIQVQFEEKVKTIEDCLRNQEEQNIQIINEQRWQNNQIINRLVDENNRMIKLVDDYNRMLNQIREDHQKKIDNLQNQLNKKMQKKTEVMDVVKDVAIVIAPLIVKCMLK
ncbi:24414_t:CDS:2 [Cetraspora pellucida]|uniref:24414_t:CDS:1 n=1 Tax=Cetraspora pellucida TaxID=1433469 RepID=A0A9N9FVJ5_9GLOM|nr:24414_t:CDS:2 [Cetraspora pellucida]